MKRFLNGCATLALFALAGCVGFRAAPLSPEQSADAFSARSFADPGLLRFLGGPPPVWDLDALTLAAFYFHPELDVARAQWRSAKAAQETAAERPNPSV